MVVVYFNQGLGAAHTKCLLKYTFFTFFVLKSKKNFQKKTEIWPQFFCKNRFFRLCTKMLVESFILRKYWTLSIKLLYKLRYYSISLCTKNIKNAYFDQPLACPAPKRWSKYTTSGPLSKFVIPLSDSRITVLSQVMMSGTLSRRWAINKCVLNKVKVKFQCNNDKTE